MTGIDINSTDKIRPLILKAQICRNTFLALVLVLDVVASLFTHNAVAAEAGETLVLEEVIVTATKREKSIQDIPLSIRAFGAEELQIATILSIDDLAQKTPNLFFADTSELKLSTPQIRGVFSGPGGRNAGIDQPVAFYVDEVYIATPAARQLDLFDLARVEVLRGPQGVLFGRNALGGAINVTTAPMGEETTGYLEASFGNYNLQRYGGAVSGKLSDSLYGKMSFLYHDREGYTENTFTGNDLNNASHWGLSGSLLWRITDSSDLTLTYRHKEVDQRTIAMDIARYTPGILGPGTEGGLTILLGLAERDDDPFDRRVSLDEDGEETLDYDLFSATLDISWDAMMLKSITAYQTHEYFQLYDLDYSTAPTMTQGNPESVDAFSQEFRLSSNNSDGLQWLVGAMYYYQKTDNQFSTIFDDDFTGLLFNIAGVPPAITDALPFGESLAQGITTLDSYATYANVDIPMGERWELSLGGRYTYEKKSIDYEQFSTLGNQLLIGLPALPASSANESWSAFTPSGQLTWNWQDNHMLYTSASQGFKSGGFNDGFGSQPEEPFEQEDLWNYEIGGKGTLLEGSMQYSLTAFYMDWSNIQSRQIVSAPGLPVALVILDTLGDATIKGAEAQLTWMPINGLIADLAYGYTKGEWKNVEPGNGIENGDAFANIPEQQVSLGLQYNINIAQSGDLILRGDANYRAETPLGGSTEAIVGQQDAFTLFNASVTYRFTDSWSVAVWVKNITDEEYIVAVRDAEQFSPFVGYREHLLGTPRTYAIRLKYDF